MRKLWAKQNGGVAGCENWQPANFRRLRTYEILQSVKFSQVAKIRNHMRFLFIYLFFEYKQYFQRPNIYIYIYIYIYIS